MFFDTHAHLDLSPLNEAEEAVVRRARDAGVTRIATVGIDPESGERAVSIAHRHTGVYAVVGLSNVWFLDGSYFRISGDHWEMSVGTGGPWRVAAVSAVPGRLYAKRHPHGAPPGQAKKKGGGRKH